MIRVGTGGRWIMEDVPPGERVPLKDLPSFFSRIMIGWKIGYCVFFL